MSGDMQLRPTVSGFRLNVEWNQQQRKSQRFSLIR